MGWRTQHLMFIALVATHSQVGDPRHRLVAASPPVVGLGMAAEQDSPEQDSLELWFAVSP